jgi:hypothetical protein
MIFPHAVHGDSKGRACAARSGSVNSQREYRVGEPACSERLLCQPATMSPIRLPVALSDRSLPALLGGRSDGSAKKCQNKRPQQHSTHVSSQIADRNSRKRLLSSMLFERFASEDATRSVSSDRFQAPTARRRSCGKVMMPGRTNGHCWPVP